MSSSTALLPKDRKLDHPIFLRVCHSPWASINQRALVGLRGLTLTYLIISFAVIIDFDLTRNNAGWLVLFKFSNVQYLLQIIYQIIAFTWTFMHLHFPHHASQIPSMTTRFQRFLSPPRQNVTAKNREFFSIFYTAANVFPHVSTFMFWAVLLPKGRADVSYAEIFVSGDWFIRFYVFNLWAVSALISLIEILFFCSIRRQSPIYAHVIGLAILSWIYLGWTYIGYVITDKYVWYFLDHKQVGWDHVVAFFFTFAGLVNFFFAIVYGITAFRELLTTKGGNKNIGYQQLPQ